MKFLNFSIFFCDNFNNYEWSSKFLRIFICKEHLSDSTIFNDQVWSTCQSLRITINTTLPLDEFTQTLFKRKTILIGDLAESGYSLSIEYAGFNVSRAYFHRGRNHMAILPKVRGYFRPGFTILRARRKSLWAWVLWGRKGRLAARKKYREISQNQLLSLDNDVRVRVTSTRRFHSKADPLFIYVYFALISIYLCIRWKRCCDRNTFVSASLLTDDLYVFVSNKIPRASLFDKI